MKYFNESEVEKFLAQAKGEKHSALFYFAIETGMRPEEYLDIHRIG